MTKIYLSGPMTGIADHNYPAFHREAKRLRKLGHKVVNPAELNKWEDTGPATDRQECLKKDIRALVGCEAIYLLPGWRFSRGAKLEHYIACALGMPAIEVEDVIWFEENAK